MSWMIIGYVLLGLLMAAPLLQLKNKICISMNLKAHVQLGRKELYQVAVTMILVSGLTGNQFEFSQYAITYLLFCYTLILCSLIDLETMILPDCLTLPLLWAGIALSAYNISPIPLVSSVKGAMFGYCSLYLIFWLYKLARGKEGLGYGDFKLYAAIGAWLGFEALPMVLLIASVTALAFALLQSFKRGKDVLHPFPFGSYLSIGAVMVLFFGDNLMGVIN